MPNAMASFKTIPYRKILDSRASAELFKSVLLHANFIVRIGVRGTFNFAALSFDIAELFISAASGRRGNVA
jgi:hypothetical protein